MITLKCPICNIPLTHSNGKEQGINSGLDFFSCGKIGGGHAKRHSVLLTFKNKKLNLFRFTYKYNYDIQLWSKDAYTEMEAHTVISYVSKFSYGYEKDIVNFYEHFNKFILPKRFTKEGIDKTYQEIISNRVFI